MIFFVRQVEYYCHLEVIACQWAELEQFINSHTHDTHSSPSGGDDVVDLDKLIEAHKKYLTKMLEKTLLKIVSTSSKRSKQQQQQQQKEQSLKNQLETIFVTMLAYKNAAVSFT
jgi:gamma-tubulin complex component 3